MILIHIMVNSILTENVSNLKEDKLFHLKDPLKQLEKYYGMVQLFEGKIAVISAVGLAWVPSNPWIFREKSQLRIL